MTKRYLILQKKLQNLESLLSNLVSVPSDETVDHDALKDLGSSLAFLKNLLSAETASLPSKPHHLQHISQRLSVLESVIRDYESSDAIAFDDRGGSSCSCTESCLNDDGDAVYEQDVEDETGSTELSETPEKYEPVVEFRDGSNGERVGDEKIRVSEGEGRVRAMAIGVIIGMTFMGSILVLVDFMDLIYSKNSVTPT